MTDYIYIGLVIFDLIVFLVLIIGMIKDAIKDLWD